MKWILFTIFLLILVVGATDGICGWRQVHQSEPMNENHETELQFQISRGFTVIDEERRTLFIDYDKRLLFNVAKDTGACKQFVISNSHVKDDFRAGQIALFSELAFTKAVHLEGVRNHLYSTYSVINAPHALLLRGIKTATLEEFGVVYTPGVTEYDVDINHPLYAKLTELAEYNAATAGEVNPLIFQLDVTHLLSRFAGVPISKKRGRQRPIELFFSTEKANVLRELLPPECDKF